MFDIVDGINQAAVSWLLSAYLALQTMLVGNNAGLFGMSLTLFIVFYGYGMLSGRITATEEHFRRLAIVVVVVVGVTNVGYFNTILRLFFLNTNMEIANGVLTAGSSTPSQIQDGLDRCFDAGFAAADAIWQNASWSDLLLNALGMSIAVATLLFVCGAAAMLVLAKVGTCILLALTPLMFLSLLFPITKSIFERWLGLLFNYWFIPILVFLILSFVTHTATSAAEAVTVAVQGDSATEGALREIVVFLSVCLIGCVLLWQCYLISSALGGGIALSTMGVGAAAFGFVRNQFRPRNQANSSGRSSDGGQRSSASSDRRRGNQAGSYKRDARPLDRPRANRSQPRRS